MLPESTLHKIDENNDETVPEKLLPETAGDSSEDEDDFETQPQTDVSRNDTPRIDEFERKTIRYSRSRTPKRSTPYRIIGERHRTIAANNKRTSNISAAFVWTIIVVIVSFIAFVVW